MDKKVLEQYLNQKLNITIFEELDSTNNYLKKLGSQGEEGTLVIAERQTGGRGRMGRSFYSPNGTGLYFSLLLRPDIPAEKALNLTVMAAVAVAETVMKYNSNNVRIKWVNDVYIDGKKVCGILTEGAVSPITKTLDYAVVGIGINVIAPENGFPDDIKDIATAIFPGKAEENLKEKIVADVVNRFFKMYNGVDTDFVERYKEYSYLTGKEINIISGENIRPATVLDITDDCHLLVKNENDEIEEISSGDVSVRLV